MEPSITPTTWPGLQLCSLPLVSSELEERAQKCCSQVALSILCALGCSSNLPLKRYNLCQLAKPHPSTPREKGPFLTHTPSLVTESKKTILLFGDPYCFGSLFASVLNRYNSQACHMLPKKARRLYKGKSKGSSAGNRRRLPLLSLPTALSDLAPRCSVMPFLEVLRVKKGD